MKKIVFALVLVASAIALNAQMTPAQEEMLRLETHLKAVRDDARGQRYWGAALYLGTAAAIGGVGYFAYEQTPASWSEVRDGVALGFGIGAGVFAVPGIITLAFRSDYERLPNEVLDMPTFSDTDNQKRLVKGELVLKSLAEKAFGDRLLWSTIYLLAGLSSVAADAATTTTIDDGYGNATTVSGTGGIGSSGYLLIAGGLVGLIFPHKAESEYNAFQEWKTQRRSGLASLDWTVGPGRTAQGKPQLVATATF